MLQGDFTGGIWRFLIGMFIRGAASASLSETLARQWLAQIPVARIMNPNPIAVPFETSVQELIDDYVWRRPHRWFPVVDNVTVVGSVEMRQAGSVDRALWRETPVGRIMRPVSPDDTVAPETDAFTALTLMRRTCQHRMMVLRNVSGAPTPLFNPLPGCGSFG